MRKEHKQFAIDIFLMEELASVNRKQFKTASKIFKGIICEDCPNKKSNCEISYCSSGLKIVLTLMNELVELHIRGN